MARLGLLIALALLAGGATSADAQERRLEPDPRGLDQLATLEEKIVSDSTVDEVAITATFSGKEIFVFGAIARNRLLREDDPAPDIAIVIEGPPNAVVVRRKARIAGMWVNQDAFRIGEAPSFYAVASTRPLDEILNPIEDATRQVSLDKSVRVVGAPISVADPESFRRAAIRLRRDQGLYIEKPGGVELKDPLYSTRLRLPASIIEGEYTVRVLLLRGGRVLDEEKIALPVRKTGLERLVGSAARETPFLYGLATLIMAAMAGWLGSEIFRRLRR